MKTTRRVSRRSFLVRVAGGTLIGGAALAVLGGAAGAAQINDNDGADPRGRGRGALTDADSGPRADRPGSGRGPRRTTCPAAHGQGRGVNDGDNGANADAPGCGRGGPRRG
ncbi:MAG: hypothetical protein QOD42_1174 [Sphingomonadales bacterium]|jgi:hypothetical protein|nr:hypothetical protein [Sphingomonadales bacterium]